MTTELVIETNGLVKRFGDRHAIAGVDLAVPEACAFGFLGPNGAGKTTLIRMLLGLTRATSGEMRLLGLPVPEQRATALARVGAIVEEPRFHAHLTGRENLRANAAARGGAPSAGSTGHSRASGSRERADERVQTYSMGMRQRLGIARCLLADPALLILDEPMNGLDPAGIIEFRGLIRSFVDEGRTVFLSSHLLDEVERTCDMVAIVDQGRVVRQGPIAEIAGGRRRLARDRLRRSGARPSRCSRGGATSSGSPTRRRAARRARSGASTRPSSTARSSTPASACGASSRRASRSRSASSNSPRPSEESDDRARQRRPPEAAQAPRTYWWSLILTVGSMLPSPASRS